MVYSSKPQCFKTESKIINKCGQSDLIISSTVFRFRAFHIPVGCGSDLERGGCWSEDGAGAGQTQSRCGLERQRGRRSSGRGSERPRVGVAGADEGRTRSAGAGLGASVGQSMCECGPHMV